MSSNEFLRNKTSISNVNKDDDDDDDFDDDDF